MGSILWKGGKKWEGELVNGWSGRMSGCKTRLQREEDGFVEGERRGVGDDGRSVVVEEGEETEMDNEGR